MVSKTVTLDGNRENIDNANFDRFNINSINSTEVVPAQGWVFNDQGEVTLTAYSTSANQIERPEQNNSSTCKI